MSYSIVFDLDEYFGLNITKNAVIWQIGGFSSHVKWSYEIKIIRLILCVVP